MTKKKSSVVILLFLAFFLVCSAIGTGQKQIQMDIAMRQEQTRQKTEAEEMEAAVAQIEESLSKRYPREFIRARAQEGRTIAILLDVSSDPDFNKQLQGSKKMRGVYLAHDVFLDCYCTPYSEPLSWIQLHIVVKPIGSVYLRARDYDSTHAEMKYGNGLSYNMVDLKWSDRWSEDMV